MMPITNSDVAHAPVELMACGWTCVVINFLLQHLLITLFAGLALLFIVIISLLKIVKNLGHRV